MADARTVRVPVKFLLAVLVIASALLMLDATPVAHADDDHGDFRSAATALPIGTGQLNGEVDTTNRNSVRHWNRVFHRSKRTSDGVWHFRLVISEQ